MKILNILKRNKAPAFCLFIAVFVPYCVYYHRSIGLKKMEDGVKQDIARIKSKGKQFSEIPKSG